MACGNKIISNCFMFLPSEAVADDIKTDCLNFNTLKLRWRQGSEGGPGDAVDCLLCGGEEETVRHFFMVCLELQEIRKRYGAYRTEALEELLMFLEKSEENVDRCKKMLEEMWRMRRIEPLSQCSDVR